MIDNNISVFNSKKDGFKYIIVSLNPAVIMIQEIRLIKTVEVGCSL